MCSSGIDQYYLDILAQEEQDKEIEDTLFSSVSFVKLSFNTFTLTTSAHQ
jgi:hypothetical protein